MWPHGFQERDSWKSKDSCTLQEMPTVPRGQSGYDCLAKVRPMIDGFYRSFVANYSPHKENAIDANPFKGRSLLKH